MAIPGLNLDNRTFDDLYEELRALIPRYCPQWTNHNTSDPGITLVELFCWIAEGLIYRSNRIPEASQRRFLELLGTPVDGTLDEARAKALEALQGPWRAVTAMDFEELVLDAIPRVARVRCLPDLDLTATGDSQARIGHVSVIIVPRPASAVDTSPSPSAELLEMTEKFLDERRLITCRHHVVGPLYTRVTLAASVVCLPGLKGERVRKELLDALRLFFAPIATDDGLTNQGWPFGRAVHESEVYGVLEGVEGVDHVVSLTLRRREGDQWQDAGQRIPIESNSLISFDDGSCQIVVTPGS